MNAQIAQHLNISEAQIKSVEIWAHVLFVRFESGRPRFVSKKVVEVKTMTLKSCTWMVGDVECKAELVTDRPQQYSGEHFYSVSAKNDKKVIDGKIKMQWKFIRNVKAAEFVASLDTMPESFAPVYA